MRPYGAPQTLERRRRRAIALLEEGLSLSEVARRLQASVGSVSQRRPAGRSGGEAALAPKPVPGRPHRLPDQQGTLLLQLLLQGPRAHGFSNALWTLKRIAAVLQVQCGRRYHPAHLWKVLRRVGWRCQVPARRPIQRNEQAVVQWKRDKWPAITKSPPPGSPPALPG
jgi:transposase